MRPRHCRFQASSGSPAQRAAIYIRRNRSAGEDLAMRKATISRNSKETQIALSLTIEGRGRYQVSTGIRFFDHMLELFAHHGGFDLKLNAVGDLDVDQH